MTTDSKPESFSKEVPDLLQTHLEHLLKSSISVDVIKERGYRTVYGSDPQLKTFGFTDKQRRRPAGILIPMYGTNGHGIVGYQYRPDNPRTMTRDDGTIREIKYETPTGAVNHFDIHPRTKENAGNPKIPCWITEGVKKGDSLVTAGAPFVITLPGVWNWRGTNQFGGKVAIPDFENVAWNGRLVYLCFDGDLWTNKNIKASLTRLVSLLKSKMAEVRIIKLPAAGDDKKKIGVDDYIHQGHTLNDVIGLETTESIKPTTTLKDRSHNKYHLHDGLLCHIQELSKGGEMHTLLCNFSAKIVEDILKNDGLDTQRYYKIIGTNHKGTNFQIVIIADTEFDGMKWPRKSWGIGAVIEAGNSIKDHLREAIEVNSLEDVVRKQIYTHTGWLEVDGKYIYLTQGGSIGEVKVDVEIPPPLDKYYLPSPDGDPVEAIKTSLEFLNIGGLKVTLPLWAAMYTSVLSEIIKPAFTLWYSGPSGSFKSVLTALALSHFGTFDHLNLIASWRDTVNSLEKKLFLAKDIPTVIDDWAPGASSSAARALDEKAEHITRGQGNRQSKGRMQADTSTRKEYPPRGLLITSGEQLPGGVSQTSRIFTVELEPEDTNTELLTEAQHKRAQYRVAMAHFVLWLSPQYGELKKELPKSFEALRDKARVGNQHPRLAEVVACLQTGLNLALLFAKEKGAIDAKEAKRLSTKGWDLLTSMAREQEERVSEESAAKRFIEGIKATVNMKAAVLQEINQPPDKLLPNQILAGWVNGSTGEAWLDPLASYQAVYQYYNRAGESFTIKRKAVWQDLSRRGYLVYSNSKRTTVTQRFNNEVRRVMALKPHILEEQEDE